MFYCEKCRERNGWPSTLSQSVGTCEVCGYKAECHDMPARLLPKPKNERGIELKPCPCCGGRAQTSSCVDYDKVFCTSCGLQTEENRQWFGGDKAERMAASVAVWNRRVNG